ncbi:uncharacterized protein LOC143232015 isoform X2 [Tachypleus tridentatus]|uniref:uncharacterized protein LOC143232015 isoform X2 n=1 Tax=Tachypleus tridentatus TaxID=6853 RepID=UPI003FD44A9F
MINSPITTSIKNSLNIGKQVSSGSHSSLLMSRVEFTASDNEQSLVAQSLQTKYHHLGAGDTHFNGQLKSSTSVDHNKNSHVKHSNMVNGGGRKLHPPSDGIPPPRIQIHPQNNIHLEWKKIHKIGAGLVNLGNTCFMNTVIQCLTYCPPLANYLLHEDDHASKCKIMGFCMMCELQKHMKRALDRPGEIIKPLYIYQKLKSIAKHFQFGRQEDAHEFLRYVVDNLWRACLSNYDGSVKLDPSSKETTVVNHIFGGYHRSQVLCLRCRERSNTYDHFMDFILDIKSVHSLEKALEKFIQPELLQNDNAYKCPKCNMKVSAQKRFTVHRAPNVATFQFKRFDYNRMLGGKITKHVTYPEKLNLRPYMSDTKGIPMVYGLNAVLVHMGSSCNSGHYFCYVRNSNGLWYIMDDARVQQVSLNQVLNQQAYVLFYVKTSFREVKKPHSACLLNHKVSANVKHSPQLLYVGRPVSQSSNDLSSKLSRNPVKQLCGPSVIQAPSNSSINGITNGVSSTKKMLPAPLQQNREKVSFGIRRFPVVLDKKPGTSTSKPVSGLVPYTEDSTESSDNEKNADDGKKPISVQSNSLHQVYNKGTHSDSVPSHEETPVVHKDTTAVKESNDSVILSNKNNLGLKPVKSHLESSSKVKATSTWHVTDTSLHSPSVASGSSNNSVISTTDWNVIDQQDVMSRLKGDRAFPGWTVTSNEKDSAMDKLIHQNSLIESGKPNNPQLSISGQSSDLNRVVNDQYYAPAVSHPAQPVVSNANPTVNSNKQSLISDVSVQLSSNVNQDMKTPVNKDREKSKEQNTCLPTIRDFRDQQKSNEWDKSKSEESKSESKRKCNSKGVFEIFPNSSRKLHQPDFSECSEKSSQSVYKKHKSKHRFELEEEREHERAIDRKQSDSSCYHRNSKHKNQSFQENHTSSLHKDRDRSDSKYVKASYLQNEKVLKMGGEEGTQFSLNETSERRTKLNGNQNLIEQSSNYKYNLNDLNNWQQKSDIEQQSVTHRFSGEKQLKHYYNVHDRRRQSKGDSSDSDSSVSIKIPEKRRKLKDNKRKQSKADFSESSYKKIDEGSKYEEGKVKQCKEDSLDSESSDSYEEEWVEKTKETLEAETRKFKQAEDLNMNMVPSKVWDEDIQVSQDQYKHSASSVRWDGSQKSDVLTELLKCSNKIYGGEVKSWDGNTSHLDQISQSEARQKQQNSDTYDEEYDKGKTKKVKKHYETTFSSSNPFQKLYNHKRERKDHHSSKSNKHRHGDLHHRNKHHSSHHSARASFNFGGRHRHR